MNVQFIENQKIIKWKIPIQKIDTKIMKGTLLTNDI